MVTQQFKEVAEQLLAEFEGTPFEDRWREAISFGLGAEANAYWVRHAEDVVNVVWLNGDGIRDITYVLPVVGESDENAQKPAESVLNFLPLRSIAALEIRQRPNVAPSFGLPVSGDKLVHVVVKAPAGSLYWVASNPSEAEMLDAFTQAVLTQYTDAAT